jgi:hypothetical protein
MNENFAGSDSQVLRYSGAETWLGEKATGCRVRITVRRSKTVASAVVGER